MRLPLKEADDESVRVALCVGVVVGGGVRVRVSDADADTLALWLWLRDEDADVDAVPLNVFVGVGGGVTVAVWLWLADGAVDAVGVRAVRDPLSDCDTLTARVGEAVGVADAVAARVRVGVGVVVSVALRDTDGAAVIVAVRLGDVVGAGVTVADPLCVVVIGNVVDAVAEGETVLAGVGVKERDVDAARDGVRLCDEESVWVDAGVRESLCDHEADAVSVREAPRVGVPVEEEVAVLVGTAAVGSSATATIERATMNGENIQSVLCFPRNKSEMCVVSCWL